MSVNKKLGMGIAGAVLSVGLIGGGTFAYFSDAETTDNTFAAGTLDLSVDPTALVEVDNLKPGDTMFRTFKLVNDGTLDISKVNISTNYSVNDYHGDNAGEDMGEHIKVNFLANADKLSNVIYSTTLADLKDGLPDAVKNKRWLLGENSGLKTGDDDHLYVQFEFVDNGKDQNIFQGDSLKLDWTFEAQQTDGAKR